MTAKQTPPIPLVRMGREDTEPVAYACGKCGIVRASEFHAQRCCDWKTCKCGGENARGYSVCKECRRKSQIARELAVFEKAEKRSISDWDEEAPLYDENADKYIRYFDDADDSDAPYLYATKLREVSVTIDDIHRMLEGILCEAAGANWLPFRTFGEVKSLNGYSSEVIYTAAEPQQQPLPLKVG